VLKHNSLSFRLIVFSGAWILVTLVIIGALLIYFYYDHASAHYDEHVSMHLEELIEASHFDENGIYRLDFTPSDPRYHNLYSGWYWEVQQSGIMLKRSDSLGDNSLSLGPIRPTGTTTVYETLGPQQEKLRTHVTELDLDTDQAPLVLLATAPMTGVKDDVANYSNHIVGSFMVLGIGLLLAVVLQVKVALQPLKAIGAGISDVREGKASKLPSEQLEDVKPLVDELNNLLDHNAVLLKRARNQLGDLAHAVKNPLTVIKNEARNLDPELQELLIQQTGDISRNVDHYLARARTFGTEKVLGSRSSIKAVVEDLVYAMQRLYQDSDLIYDFSPLNDCWFRGEGQDLEEMVGNLMDNACKWANGRVKIRGNCLNDQLTLTVEDDGPGIPDGKIDEVMRRGHRLDETKPGHGQGLGIVKDIAELYGGTLTLGSSELGGLKAELVLPAA
jgi:signal transduction histidine kinase